jgi:LmbE family N-acetylglucosaminyl deacetylase
MSRILAIVSHPDDETFGCGGTLKIHAKDSSVLCLTCNPIERRSEIKKACKTLGLMEPMVWEEDAVVPSGDLVRRVSDVIIAKKPNLIITHLPFDYHSDHRATYDIVKEAIEWAAHTTINEKPHLVERLLLMEINTLIPTPHIIVDISKAMGSKKEAVEAYSTQLAKFPWGYYQRFGEKKAELRGAQANCGYAEAFIEEAQAKNGPFYEAKATTNLLW